MRREVLNLVASRFPSSLRATALLIQLPVCPRTMEDAGPLDADYFSAADESDNARGTSRPTRQEIQVQVIQPPRVEQRPEKTYLGIRVVTPFRGMLRTDPRTEPRKTKWEVELNMRVA